MENSSRFHFDGHHAIELFGIEFLIICMALSLMTGICKYTNIQNGKQQLGSIADYTGEFESEKGHTGQVVGVYASKDRTKGFLMWHIDSMDGYPAEGLGYHIYVSAYQDHLNVEPTCAFYCFGQSGYMGLYLVAEEGFPMQIMQVDVNVGEDENFENPYDTFRMNANFAASEAKSADFLEASDIVEASKVYTETVLQSEEDEIRQDLETDIETIQKGLADIEEYKSRLMEQGVRVVPDPTQIYGDKVVADEETGILKYMTSYVFDGGLNFDWQSKHISDGYIDDLRGDMGYAQYLNYLKEQQKNNDEMEVPEEWYYQNGQKVITDAGGVQLQDEKAITENIEKLKTAWSKVYDTKKKYQTEDLYNLIYLESESIVSDQQLSVVKDGDRKDKDGNLLRSVTIWQQK